jgi:nucleotide-binding universal stress UspA family protein
MYRHILIPTDGSELAERGVAHGLALAKSLGAKVFVIYVVEPLLAGMSRSLLNYFGRTLPNECYAALVTWATGLIVIRSW